MSRAAVAVLAALATLACPQSAAADPTAASIDRFLDGALPGGASGTLATARGDQTLYCKGFGLANRSRRIPATGDTVYDIGSLTKQFTAAAILKLQMMGRLTVDDPISTHLGPMPADKRAITLHQLLTHTSGLTDGLGDDDEPVSRRRLIARALASKLRSPPGTRNRYSNLGYSLLAAIVETTSGMGYEEFLSRHLLRPAGMTQTGYVLPRWKTKRVAIEYDPRGRSHGRPFDHPWAADGPYWNLRGNGGLLSTARDMVRWHRALEDDAILDQPAKAALFKRHVKEAPGGDTYSGYGWVILPTAYGKVAWHNGGNGWSYGELLRVLDGGVLVFWITNRSRDTNAGWDFERLGPKLSEGVVRRVHSTVSGANP